MQLFELMDAAMAERYAHLTYPYYRPLLGSLGAKPSVVAIAAGVLGRPVGLALAEIGTKNSGVGAIRSIYVTPELRGAGHGTALLERAEAALRNRGCERVELVYPVGKPTTPALEALLRKRGWEPPCQSMLMAEGPISAVWQASHRELAPLPPPFQVVPWSTIADHEIQSIAASHESHPWIPSPLLPWNWQSEAEPRTSLGLRFHDDVVGWMINHQIGDATLRFSCGWVREDLQLVRHVKPFLVLFLDSVRRADQAGFERGVWYVSPGQPRMVALSIRRALRAGGSYRETMRTEKVLAPRAPGAGSPAGEPVATGAGLLEEAR